MKFRIICGAVLASYLLVGSCGLEDNETTIQESSKKIANNIIQSTSNTVQANFNNTIRLRANATAVKLNLNKLEFASNNVTKRRVIIIKKEEKGKEEEEENEESKEDKEEKEEKSALRQGPKRHRKRVKKITSLLYQELDEDNNKITEFMMYTLADVSTFFESFLNVELCINECDD